MPRSGGSATLKPHTAPQLEHRAWRRNGKAQRLHPSHLLCLDRAVFQVLKSAIHHGLSDCLSFLPSIDSHRPDRVEFSTVQGIAWAIVIVAASAISLSLSIPSTSPAIDYLGRQTETGDPRNLSPLCPPIGDWGQIHQVLLLKELRYH